MRDHMKKTAFCLLLTAFSCLSGAIVESVTPNGFASPFQIRKDLPGRFEFRIDTPANAVKEKNMLQIGCLCIICTGEIICKKL